jgi:hypothetical protein
MGERHQLPAVGRGGVLDLAARWARPETGVSPDVVHRFTDPDYAELSLALRTIRVSKTSLARTPWRRSTRAIRDQLVATGYVDDQRRVATGAGEHLGVAPGDDPTQRP